LPEFLKISGNQSKSPAKLHNQNCEKENSRKESENCIANFF